MIVQVTATTVLLKKKRRKSALRNASENLESSARDGVAREFARLGYPVTQKGFFTGRHPNGGHTGMYTYLDTAGPLGTVLELLEHFDPEGEVR